MLYAILILPLANPFTVVFLFLTLVAGMKGLPSWIVLPMLAMAFWSSGLAGVGWVLPIFVVGRIAIHVLGQGHASQTTEIP